MSLAFLLTYAHNILDRVPWGHWLIMGLFALAVLLFARKKSSLYVATMIGLAAFACMFLLDTAVVIRYCGNFPHASGVNLVLFHGGGLLTVESLANLAACIPFGFFLSEFLASAKSFSAGRRLGIATLAGFGLSLCIECLQLLLRVGYFELTDLVMNTVGTFVGALISAGVRKVVGREVDRFSEVG